MQSREVETQVVSEVPQGAASARSVSAIFARRYELKRATEAAEERRHSRVWGTFGTQNPLKWGKEKTIQNPLCEGLLGHGGWNRNDAAGYGFERGTA